MSETGIDRAGRADGAGHLLQLDGLRAFAVLAVLFSHTVPAARPFLNAGVFGVRLFFVLSGFLITGILLGARAQVEDGRDSTRHVVLAFYTRRFLRIFPLYYCVLIAATLLDLPEVRKTFLWHVSYLSNYYIAVRGAWPGEHISHLWSLSVEEQFYLAWPALVLFAPRRWLMPLFLGLIVLAPVCRFTLMTLTGNVLATQLVTFSSLDSLGLGGLLALFHTRKKDTERIRRRLGRAALWVGGSLFIVIRVLTVMGIGRDLQFVVEYTGHALISVWLVDRAVNGFRGIGKAILEFKPLVYVGSISYGVYVFHAFIPPLMARLGQSLHLVTLHLPESVANLLEVLVITIARGPYVLSRRGQLVSFVAICLLTVPLAALSWHWLEKPLNDLKRHFPYVRGERSRSPELLVTAAKSPVRR